MRLFVGNLSKDTTRAQLTELATPYGKIVSARLAIDPTSGEAKGFGFVEFTSADEGRAAIAGLDGRDISGQALKVNEAKPRKERVPSPAEH